MKSTVLVVFFVDCVCAKMCFRNIHCLVTGAGASFASYRHSFLGFLLFL